MRAPTCVREITDEERKGLTQALRSSAALRMRRAQMILARSRGERAAQSGRTPGCDDQTVRDAIAAFEERGLGALERGSHVPHTLPHKVLDAQGAEQMRALLHRSPREFGHSTSLWTLALVAEEAARQGISGRRLGAEAVRLALLQAAIPWKRARRWISSPTPQYERKKRRRDRLIRLAQAHPDRAPGFEDESWCSRTARPACRSWTDDQPFRLVARADPDPHALACYGLILRRSDQPAQTLRRWAPAECGDHPVPGRGVCQLCAPGCACAPPGLGERLLAPLHVRPLLDPSSGSSAPASVSACASVRCPWLNPIEPHRLPAKTRSVARARLLAAPEVADRVCAAVDAPHHPHLSIPEKAA